MQTIAPAHVDSPFHFSLFEPEKIPNSLLHMEHIDAGYGDTCILKNVDFQLLPGDRIGLLGPNGAGKSTFIKVLANQLKIQSGEYRLAKETKIGYFAQHQLEQLHDEHSPIEHLQQIDDLLSKRTREADLRNYLGRFGFSNDMALAKIQNFSGGEKSRLVLAMLIYQKPNLLLLDEPTNHLDLEMREALAEALQEFSGFRRNGHRLSR
jgi:ATP-binding cassette subfamily F protein 3